MVSLLPLSLAVKCISSPKMLLILIPLSVGFVPSFSSASAAHAVHGRETNAPPCRDKRHGDALRQDFLSFVHIVFLLLSQFRIHLCLILRFFSKKKQSSCRSGRFFAKVVVLACFYLWRMITENGFEAFFYMFQHKNGILCDSCAGDD